MTAAATSERRRPPRSRVPISPSVQRTVYITQNWLRNRNTIEFLGIWEQRKQAGLNSFILTAKRWIESTRTIGLISRLVGTAEPRPTRTSPSKLIIDVINSHSTMSR